MKIFKIVYLFHLLSLKFFTQKNLYIPTGGMPVFRAAAGIGIFSSMFYITTDIVNHQYNSILPLAFFILLALAYIVYSTFYSTCMAKLFDKKAEQEVLEELQLQIEKVRLEKNIRKGSLHRTIKTNKI